MLIFSTTISAWADVIKTTPASSAKTVHFHKTFEVETFPLKNNENKLIAEVGRGIC